MSTAKDRQVGGEHYKRMAVQPWDVVDTWPVERQLGYYRGSAVKYVLRAGDKGSELEDLQKAQHYLEKTIEILAAQGEKQ